MRTFTCILVDIDSRAASHRALDEAAAIARVTGAHITVVDVMANEDIAAAAAAGTDDEVLKKLRERLDALAANVIGAKAHAKILFGTPVQALIDEAARSGADVLIRSHARDLSSVRPGPYGPIDHELVRRCPIPVLLVAGIRADRPRVVAAVEPGGGRPEVTALNRVVVDYALTMAAISGGSAEVLSAATPLAEWRLRSHGGNEHVAAYVARHRQEVIEELANVVVCADGGADVRLIAEHGRVDTVLPDYVVSHSADLVVIGVPARRGLARLLMGSTAERLLRRLPCSVLAVKPDRLRSPATRRWISKVFNP